eukprot:jgi/Pico_ML_1/53233/g3811.t2
MDRVRQELDTRSTSPLLREFAYPPDNPYLQRKEVRKRFTQDLAQYESLDYEIKDSDVALAEFVTLGPKGHRLHVAIKWVFCFLIGVSMAVVAFSVNLAAVNIAAAKFHAIQTYLNDDRKGAAFVGYAGINVACALVAVLVVTLVAPSAAGSGIPDVKAYLNGINVLGVLWPRTLLAKAVGSIGAVAAGLPDNAIKNLFSTDTIGEFSIMELLIFFCSYFPLAVLVYGISVPSGLFIPGILCGASYGRIMGMLVMRYTGSTNPNVDLDESTYALIGAASFLGGSMRMTDMNKWVDLTPFVNRSCYVVHEDSNLEKVYAEFRKLGLRHLCVVPKPKEVLGVITRKDIMRGPELEKVDELDEEVMSWQG